MADATVTAVETTVKTDVTSELAKLKADFAALEVKAKADLAALEAKMFNGKTLAIAVGVSLVVGLIVGHFA